MSGPITLQAGSPCINAGVGVGLTEDYDGNAVADPPDMGAYESAYPPAGGGLLTSMTMFMGMN